MLESLSELLESLSISAIEGSESPIEQTEPRLDLSLPPALALMRLTKELEAPVEEEAEAIDSERLRCVRVPLLWCVRLTK
jgi:hypothetical protein